MDTLHKGMEPDADEEAMKDREIRIAATTLLLAAFTISVISPLVLFVAYLFHSNIFAIR
jgi:hypothetical protein